MATTKIQPAGIANGGVTQTDAQALTNKDLSGGTTTAWLPLPEPDLLFEKSLLIEFKSSVTDATSARFAYRVIPRYRDKYEICNCK